MLLAGLGMHMLQNWIENMSFLGNSFGSALMCTILGRTSLGVKIRGISGCLKAIIRNALLKEALALGTTWPSKAHFNPRRVGAFGRAKCTLERTPTRHENPQTSAGLRAVTRDF